MMKLGRWLGAKSAGKEITSGVCKVERMDKLARLSSGGSPGIITQSDAKCPSGVIMRK